MTAPHTPSVLTGPSRSIATWLGVLFVLLMVLISVGGYVRLSGSGLSIPDWPLIHIGESRSVLPPLSEAGWVAVRERYDHDQNHLVAKVESGAVGMGSLGFDPATMSDFKRMFLIEWTHRFVAAILGLVALGCLTVSLRHRELRRSVAPRIGAIVGLIVFQAVLGGILVKSGTATHWLFLHLGTAAIILSLIVWSLLRSTMAPEVEPVSSSDLASRKRLRRMTIVTAFVVWIQLMLGALVAGSRAVGHIGSGADNLSHTWPKMYGHFVPPDLWVSANGLPWNLLDNFVLHQWTHRWFAFLVLLHLGLVFWRARLTPIGQRANLALQVSATFLGVQIILGLANVYLGAPVLVALGHLLTANLILVSLVLVIHDLRYEPSCETMSLAVTKEGSVSA